MIGFVIFFSLTFRSCNYIIHDGEYLFGVVMYCLLIGGIFGYIGKIIGKKFMAEQEPKEVVFLKRYKKVLISIAAISLVLTYFYNDIKYLIIEKPASSKLVNNLENLNGTWAWHDKKNDDTWMMILCTSKDGLSGSYKIGHMYDKWGRTSSEIEVIDQGNFKLIEDYDRYRDKAYVAIRQENNHRIFVITQIENKFASDWMLRLCTVEEEMFGEAMVKLDNDCSSTNEK